MFQFVLTLLLFSYAIFCTGLALIWLFWKPFQFSNDNYKGVSTEFDGNLSTALTVIIPVRNEAENILSLLHDLEKQSLPLSCFEVIIANDNSSDNTRELVEEFALKSRLRLGLINLPEKERNTSPKKRAITESLKKAKGEIIVTTDGDCRVSDDWLLAIESFFKATDAVFVSAPVLFSNLEEANLLGKLWNAFQQIEFASLIVSGSVSMKTKQPNMCSGANMAYLKSAFEAVKGFTGNESLASGDDEFLMHKMAKQFPDKVHYLKSFEAVVRTASLPNFSAFYRQRKRWAGKWVHYDGLSPKLVAIFIFMANFACILVALKGLWSILLLKLLPEFMFLAFSVSFFKKPKLIFLIPFLQILYPFYVVFFGLVSLNKSTYIWKDRELN